MAFDVWPTVGAVRDLAKLRGPVLKAARQAREEFQAHGCQAAHYGLRGAGLDGICCRHVYGSWRMIVGFPATDQVCVLLVGEHVPAARSDVYARMYEALGIGMPVGARDSPAALTPKSRRSTRGSSSDSENSVDGCRVSRDAGPDGPGSRSPTATTTCPAKLM